MTRRKELRDEYLLHNQPLHSFRQYTTAHALAGDLELAPADKVTKRDERTEVLGRLARRNIPKFRKGVLYRGKK